MWHDCKRREEKLVWVMERDGGRDGEAEEGDGRKIQSMKA